MARVAVVGGGIAGLSAAFFRARLGDDVTLFESAPHVGGQLATLREYGFVVEQGAEGYVAGSEVMAELATELGIETSVVGQLVTNSWAFDGQTLHELGRGEAGQFLGFQVPRRDVGQGIRSFRAGMAEVAEALAEKLKPLARLHANARVERLERRGNELELAVASSAFVADRVIVATTARSAASLLGPLAGAPAVGLGAAVTSSSVTVSLAFPRAAITHSLGATGFVVTESGQVDGFRACTFTSSKLPGRAPFDQVLLRVFFRPNPDDLQSLTDAEWTTRAERCLAKPLAPRASAVRAWVARWPNALPVFDGALEARVLALEATLAGTGVTLAGAAFHGAGIDGALRSARRVAEHTV